MTEKILVIDTETANTLDDALVYDIGFVVADFDGTIYEHHSYTIADVFLDKELMSTAYFAEKMPHYWEDITNGKRQLRRLSTVRRIIADVCRQYSITKMYAFNARFDWNALLTTTRYMTDSRYRYYMPYGIECHDILKLAREVFREDESYKNWCIANNYTLANGKTPRHTAEIVARYLFDENFVEDHTACEDAVVEYYILCELLRRGGEVIDTKMW